MVKLILQRRRQGDNLAIDGDIAAWTRELDATGVDEQGVHQGTLELVVPRQTANHGTVASLRPVSDGALSVD